VSAARAVDPHQGIGFKSRPSSMLSGAGAGWGSLGGAARPHRFNHDTPSAYFPRSYPVPSHRTRSVHLEFSSCPSCP
jgi:hypothetical protein